MEIGNMRVLITGGAGFIGSHLAEAYLMNGHDVYIIDDLSTGALANVKHLQKEDRYKKRLSIFTDSILNFDLMLELIATCDVVFHLAAAVGRSLYFGQPP